MSQVTIYIDKETEARAKAAAQEAGVSLSRWITSVIRSRVGQGWPADVAAMAGSWRPTSDASEEDDEECPDLPREPL